MWRMAVCGLGFGFFQAPNNRVMLSSAPRSRAGAAGGMLATARFVGFTVGSTLAAVMFRVAPGRAETVDLVVAASFAVVATAVSLLRLSKRGRDVAPVADAVNDRAAPSVRVRPGRRT